jgi:tetratricopeptide (TPR) repeat protein
MSGVPFTPLLDLGVCNSPLVNGGSVDDIFREDLFQTELSVHDFTSDEGLEENVLLHHDGGLSTASFVSDKQDKDDELDEEASAEENGKQFRAKTLTKRQSVREYSKSQRKKRKDVIGGQRKMAESLSKDYETALNSTEENRLTLVEFSDRMRRLFALFLETWVNGTNANVGGILTDDAEVVCPYSPQSFFVGAGPTPQSANSECAKFTPDGGRKTLKGIGRISSGLSNISVVTQSFARLSSNLCEQLLFRVVSMEETFTDFNGNIRGSTTLESMNGLLCGGLQDIGFRLHAHAKVVDCDGQWKIKYVHLVYDQMELYNQMKTAFTSEFVEKVLHSAPGDKVSRPERITEILCNDTGLPTGNTDDCQPSSSGKTRCRMLKDWHWVGFSEGSEENRSLKRLIPCLVEDPSDGTDMEEQNATHAYVMVDEYPSRNRLDQLFVGILECIVSCLERNLGGKLKTIGPSICVNVVEVLKSLDKIVAELKSALASPTDRMPIHEYAICLAAFRLGLWLEHVDSATSLVQKAIEMEEPYDESSPLHFEWLYISSIAVLTRKVFTQLRVSGVSAPLSKMFHFDFETAVRSAGATNGGDNFVEDLDPLIIPRTVDSKNLAWYYRMLRSPPLGRLLDGENVAHLVVRINANQAKSAVFHFLDLVYYSHYCVLICSVTEGAATYTKENNHYNALELIEQALGQDSNFLLGNAFRHMLLLRLQRVSECVDSIKLTIASEPSHYLSHALLGFIEYSTKEFAEAIESFQRVKAINPLLNDAMGHWIDSAQESQAREDACVLSNRTNASSEEGGVVSGPSVAAGAKSSLASAGTTDGKKIRSLPRRVVTLKNQKLYVDGHESTDTDNAFY